MKKKAKIRKPNKKMIIKQLERECMALWAQFVHARAKGKCELCGKAGHLEAHHIFTKGGHLATRYAPDNGIALCFFCHRVKIHRQGAQDLGVWLIANRGIEWYEQLRQAAKVTIHDKLMFLEDEKEFLKGLSDTCSEYHIVGADKKGLK